MAYGAAIALVAATAVSAYSAYQQGQAQKKAEEYNAEVASINATNAKAAAASQETDQQFRSTQLLGAQKAAAGAAGVDPNTGSPLNIMTDTTARATLDQLRTKYQGDVGATSYLNQGGLDTYYAKAYQQAGVNNAAASILNGVSLYGMGGGFSGRYGMGNQMPTGN